MSDLLRRAVEIQKRNGWNQAEMARRLGISRSMWTMVLNGTCQPGQKVLDGLSLFDELALSVMEFQRQRAAHRIDHPAA